MALNAEETRRDRGQGEVRHPETDRRLKENGGGSRGQGKVKDPAQDRRLKANRPAAR